MENTYKISHTACPDGSIIMYSDGMTKPEILNLGDMMKKSVFNALTQNRAKAAQIIKLKVLKQVASPMYAVK